jgi:hypothetical protein
LIVANNKGASPTWIDVKTSLLTFDRAGLYGLLQDLYAASTENRAFFHARLGLGPDQFGPYKAAISRWINPDFMKGQPVSVSKAKKAVADYKKAIGRPEGLAERRHSFARRRSASLNPAAFRMRPTLLL